MKSFNRFLDIAFVLTAATFFLMMATVVVVQCFALVTMNGPLSISITGTLSKPAGVISAVCAIITIVISYLRKWNTNQD